MKQKIYIHGGAHRTGSSSFQLCLHENRTLLEDLGYIVAQPGRDGVPKGNLRLKLPSPKDNELTRAAKFRFTSRHLESLLESNAHSAILSEENIPGAMIHFYKGEFFPAARARLRSLRKMLSGNDISLVYVIRPYQDLFYSMYRFRAARKPTRPFELVAPNFLKIRQGWTDLINIFIEELEPETFKVISYEKRGSNVSLLKMLVPQLSGLALADPISKLNSTPTDSALFEIQRGFKKNLDLSQREISEIIVENADRRDDLAFSKFSSGDMDYLLEKYQGDLDEIEKMDVVLVR